MPNTNNSINAYYSNVENLCIAGDFTTNPWQRLALGQQVILSSGGSTQGVTGVYVPDGFAILSAAGLGQATITQASSAVPVSLSGTVYSPYCLQVAASGNSSLTGTQGGYIYYTMEGYDVEKIYNRYFTLSFCAYSSITGTYSVLFSPRSATSTMQNYYVSTYTITAANTWQKFSITIPPDPFSNVTWNFGNGVGGQFLFSFGCASGATTSTINTWIDSATNVYAASGQTNLYAGGTFQLNLVQIEQGLIANPFQLVPQALTLQKCMRYYQKSFPQGTTPTTAAGISGAPEFYTTRAASTAGAISPSVIFPVPMRTTPSLGFFNPVTGGSFQVRNISNNLNCTATTFASNNNEKLFNAQFTTSGGATSTTSIYAFHYTADASF